MSWSNYAESKPPSVAPGEIFPDFIVWDSLLQQPRIASLAPDGQFYYGNEHLIIDWWMFLRVRPDPETLSDTWLKYPQSKPEFGANVLVWSCRGFCICRFSNDGFLCPLDSGTFTRPYGTVFWLPLQPPQI